MESLFVLLPVGFLILFILLILVFVSRYKRCPSDKILVIYGKTGGGTSAKTLAGGAAFVVPVFQSYEYLDLTPISIDVNLVGALSKQNIRVNVPSRFTVGISTKEDTMLNAAERLLGKTTEQIREIAKDILFGQLRLVVATMDIEEINSDRDKFLSNVATNVDAELRKIGLSLINVNVTDIQDESGYIEALGKEAAAKAINDAKMSVAEKTRDGSIGEANARRDQRIKVSDAEAGAKVGEAESNAKAINGENESLILIAKSNAERQVAEAEALRKATAAEKIQKAKSLEDAYLAEKEAEMARAARELAKQAEGFDQLVKASGGNSRDAILMLIADKLENLVATQVEAIKNIKIDKVTVWDGGNGSEGEGNSTSKFVSGLYKSVPPLSDLLTVEVEAGEVNGKNQ